MKTKFSPWLAIDNDPPNDPPAGSGGGEESEKTVSYEEYQAVIDKLEGKEKALSDSRKIERQYQRLRAEFGELNPDRLQELNEIEKKYQQSEAAKEQQILAARNEVAGEYKPQLEALGKENQQLRARVDQLSAQVDGLIGLNVAVYQLKNDVDSLKHRLDQDPPA